MHAETAVNVAQAAFMRDVPRALPPADRVAGDAPPVVRSLALLETMVRRDLDLIGYPIRSWVLPKVAPDGSAAYDVVLVGGGQSGLASAFGLQRQRVTNILVCDENPRGYEGPWATYGRMWSLASDKHVGGMDLGLPSLSTRAWYEAQFGAGAWEAVDKLPKAQWHAYLKWYRAVLDLPVRNECRLRGFRDAGGGLLALDAEEAGAARVIWTRKLVLATGIEGNGPRVVPPFIADKVPADRWRHCYDTIDFERLRGRRVGVLGGAASAFDNAATAAEHGAAAVHLYHRRPELNPTNPIVWSRFNGILAHFADLDPATRWRFINQMQSVRPAPPAETYARALGLPNLTIHAGAWWTDAAPTPDGGLRIEATDGAIEFDYVILGTGSVVDLTGRRELAAHADSILLWRDVYTPPSDGANPNLARAPYLGPCFEFQEKSPGLSPWLASVFNFSRGAQLSMGTAALGLSGVKLGVPRLIHGICRQLFCEDADTFLEGLRLWQASGAVTEG
jgi:cation diffusion facilitator CzcD-associated flavoprotein CzcO